MEIQVSIDAIQNQQAAFTDTSGSGDMIVLGFKNPADVAAVKESLTSLLASNEFKVEQTFPKLEGKQPKFFTVIFPGVHLTMLPGGPFAFSHQLYDALDLDTCDPVFAVEETSGMPTENIVQPLNADDLSNTSADWEWHLKTTHIPQAWEHSNASGMPVGGAGIMIAQPDTGRAGHVLTDASGSIPPMFKPGTGRFANKYSGEDPLDYSGELLFPGHGLAVGCVAAGRGKGTKETLRGAAPQAQVVPYRTVVSVVLEVDYGYIHLSRALDQITAGDPEEAQVVSISLGGRFPPQFIAWAIRKATEAGKIIVAAAGNLPGWTGRPVCYPGWDGNTICVAATDKNNERWGKSPDDVSKSSAVAGDLGSCHGPAVTISAPGAGVKVASRSTQNHNIFSVGEGSGTSYSTALVAGICAMWLAHHGRAKLIKHYGGKGNLKRGFEAALAQSYIRPEGWDSDTMGFGIVDAEKLLKSLPTWNGAPVVASRDDVLYQSGKLIAAGASLEMVNRLSPEDLRRYGGELLWLSLSKRDADRSDSALSVSPQLARSLI